MDAESKYLLQKLDCNCNDCKFMIRDFEKFNQSLQLHEKWQYNEFIRNKNSLNDKINKAYRVNELESGYSMEQELNKMKFQFDKKECSINYGNCSKFNKPVSFIPNTCQLETQECFEHRKD